MFKISLCLIVFVLVEKFVNALECPSVCNVDKCQTSVNCSAGFVKDNCDCCQVCGALEGEKCYNEKISGYQEFNKCGNQMACELINIESTEDAEKPEAYCKCLSEEKVCGSDGKTYNNLCHLTESSYNDRDALIAVAHGPCKYPPKLINQPIDVINETGSHVVFTCGFSGWPLPAIEWKLISAEKENSMMISLPGDVKNLILQTRGGPKAYEITSIIQISFAESSHEGIYQCRAINEIGEATASAKLSLSQLSKATKNVSA